MEYTQPDIIKALKKSGIVRGDTVFFTTSLGMLGIPKIKKIKSINDICFFVFVAIKKILGPEGTILVPTYSYSFGGNFSKKKLPIFDPLKTPSKVGPFPSFFRKQKGVIRSIDPMMSIAGLGPKAKKILKNIPTTSYGKGCVFEKILKIRNAKCCSIGLGPNWIPFIHYVDWKNKAPFRYDKFFNGIIVNKKIKKRVSWHYPVPYLRKETNANGHKIGKLACKKGIYKRSKLGRSAVYTINYKRYFNFVIKLTKLNPWLTVDGPKFNTKKTN